MIRILAQFDNHIFTHNVIGGRADIDGMHTRRIRCIIPNNRKLWNFLQIPLDTIYYVMYSKAHKEVLHGYSIKERTIRVLCACCFV